MFTIILIIVASFVGYNYFVKDHALKNAPKGVVMQEEDDPEAFNAFLKKMSFEVLKDEIVTSDMIRDFFYKVRDNKYDKKEIEKTYEKMRRRLTQHIEDVNGRAAPKKFFDAHKKNAEGLGHMYQCIVALRATPKAKTPEERKKLLEDAGKHWRQGRAGIDYAKSIIRHPNS
ncbi:MAG: hypothetical protein AB1758_23060 [Candidatus Eremiobacterota bacterium]